MGFNFSIVVFVYLDLLEPMTLIEGFGSIIGNLHMEVDSPDFGLSMSLRGFEY